MEDKYSWEGIRLGGSATPRALSWPRLARWRPAWPKLWKDSFFTRKKTTRALGACGIRSRHLIGEGVRGRAILGH
jgi:hypothetical protein